MIIGMLSERVTSGKIRLQLFPMLEEVLSDATGVTGVRIRSLQDATA